MCDDLPATIESLAAKGVACAEIGQAEWGLYTAFSLPSGGALGLYQPQHPTPLKR